MPLELRPATEEDAARAAEIEGLAFAPSPFSGILFPGPFPPGSGGRRVAELVEKLRGDDSTRWLKVVDTDLLLEGTGEGEGEGESGKQEEKEKQPTMIAFAQWHVYADGKPRSAPRTFGPECNLEACEMLFGGIDRQRRRLMGERPYVCEFSSFPRVFLLLLAKGGGWGAIMLHVFLATDSGILILLYSRS